MKLQKGFHLKHLQKHYFSRNKFNERCERHWKPHEVGHYWEKLNTPQGNGEYTTFLETHYWKDVTSAQMDLKQHCTVKNITDPHM